MDDEDEHVRRLAFETMLDGSRDASEQIVEMTTLRRLCATGIPGQPRHLRPLAWSLLLETLPPAKRAWHTVARRQRERYYAMVQRYMEELESAPPPSHPLSPQDALLASIARDVDRFQSANPFLRTKSKVDRSSPLGPPKPESSILQPVEAESDGQDSSSSETGSSEDETTIRAKEDPMLKGKMKRKQVEKLTCRRAAFVRAEVVAEAVHRRHAAEASSSSALSPKIPPRQAAAENSSVPAAGQSDGEMNGHTGNSDDVDTADPEISLSPRITLSPDTSDQFKSTSFEPSPAVSTRLESLRPAKLALDVHGGASSSSPHSAPITLVSPKVIPSPGQAASSLFSGSLLQPDTHAEILIRILYTGCRAHPHWSYDDNLLYILLPLYMTYCGIDLPRGPLIGKQKRNTYTQPQSTLRYAEEQTFWAFTSFMEERASWTSAGANSAVVSELSLRKLASRIRWGDGQLLRFLDQNGLGVTSSPYASQWLTTVFAALLPVFAIPIFWDIILAEQVANNAKQPRLDALIDLAAGLILASKDVIVQAAAAVTSIPPPSTARSKQRSMWDESGAQDPEPEWDSQPVHEEIRKEVAEMFNEYPLRAVGGVDAVLRIARQLKEARMLAELTGDDPDGTVNQAGLAPSASWTWLAEKANAANKAASAQLARYTTSKPATSGEPQLQHKESFASFLHANPLASQSANLSSLGGAASRLFQRATAKPPQAEEDPYTSLPSSPRSRQRRSQHRSTIDPASSAGATSSNDPSIANGLPRERSDTVSSGFSVGSLHDRLASLGQAFAPRPPAERPVSGSSSPLPRPLLLSNAARRTSGSSLADGVDRFRRGSSPIIGPRSAPGTPPTATLSATHNGPLSPPTHYGSADSPKASGLYRIGSRQAAPRPSSISSNPMSPEDQGSRNVSGMTLEPAPTLTALSIIGRLASRARYPGRLPVPIIAATLPALAVGVGLASRRQMSTGPRDSHPRYPGHVPLSWSQNALLAVGSGVMGVLDTSRGDLIATLSESTASTFLPRLHETMTAHPEGRQILRDRPLVSSSTVDIPALKRLQRGTLGREYVEWLERNQVTPDTRELVRYIDSPTLAYTMTRYRQTHDLYHTLFSLPTSLPHELTLKVVELSNMSLPVAGLSSTFGPLRLSAARRQVWMEDWVPWALRTGRQGKSLVGVYWEKRWEQGVGELRRELGVSRNEKPGVEGRWKGYRETRGMERELRHKGEWIDEPEEW